MQKSFAYSIIFLAMFSVGWAAIFIRWCEGLHPLLISFYRMAWATLLLAPFTIFRASRTYRGVGRKDIWMMVLIGFVLALHFATWIWSLFYTTIASSTVLVTTQPIFLVLFSLLFTSEKVGRFSVFSIILAMVGVVIISWGDMKFTGEYLKGDLLALAGAVCAAVYLFLGRTVRQRVANLAYVQTVYACSAVFLLIMVFMFTDFKIAFPFRFHFWLILLGLVPTVVGHSLYNWALKRIRAYIVGASILGEPLGASLYAWLIFKEVPSGTTFMGAGLIFIGVVFLFYSERKNIS